MARLTVGTEAPEDARATAFTRLTAVRLVSCYRLATVILGDPVEAEDATHDAAARAWERWGSLRDLDRFDAWFGRILVNECRDRLRRRRLSRRWYRSPSRVLAGGLPTTLQPRQNGRLSLRQSANSNRTSASRSCCTSMSALARSRSRSGRARAWEQSSRVSTTPFGRSGPP